MKIREILPSDYYLGYLDLVKQLSQYESNIDYSEFEEYLKSNQSKIFVMLNNDHLVGCGSIFFLKKLHTNPIAQIEDVVIDNNERGKGYGKKIIEFLIQYTSMNTNCYKIILNCNHINLDFYLKCGFINSGYQCKILV